MDRLQQQPLGRGGGGEGAADPDAGTRRAKLALSKKRTKSWGGGEAMFLV
jgi:hypothetical protein